MTNNDTATETNTDTDLERRRAGCFIAGNFDADELPAGWVEIQREDNPEDPNAYRFADDEEAARWVSRAARYYHPDTGRSYSIDSEPDHGAIVIVPTLDAADLELI